MARTATHRTSFMFKIKSQLKKASDLKKEDYGFFFASAGHSALYDYPTAKHEVKPSPSSSSSSSRSVTSPRWPSEPSSVQAW